MRKAVSRIAALDFQRSDLDLLRDLADRVPWEAALNTMKSRKAGPASGIKSYRRRHRLWQCNKHQTSNREDQPGWLIRRSGRKKRPYKLY